MEGSFSAWHAVRERALRLPAAPTPPVVFFTRYCTYALSRSAPAQSAIRVRAGTDTLRGSGAAHGGRIVLPNGLAIAVRAEAFASLLPGDSATFLVLALEDVWADDPAQGGRNENWPAYLRRTFVHEMTHARQLTARAPQLRVVGGQLGLSDFDDDIIQLRFDSVAGFRQSIERETALLYSAAAAPTDSARRAMARRALRLIANRRTIAYGSAEAPWARLEQLLLDMEGVAQWAALAHVRLTSRLGPAAQLDVVRGSRQYWSQDQGLALYMVVAALVPDWSARVFSADPPTAIELLERALSGR